MSSWFKIFYIEYVNTLKYVTNLLKRHNFQITENIQKYSRNRMLFKSILLVLRYLANEKLMYVFPPCCCPQSLFKMWAKRRRLCWNFSVSILHKMLAFLKKLSSEPLWNISIFVHWPSASHITGQHISWSGFTSF